MAALNIPQDVRLALAEDVGTGDLSARLIPTSIIAQAHVISREAAILCGNAWFDETFRQLDPKVNVQWKCTEGESISAGQTLCMLNGPARSIVTGERVALNFLQLLSGTATTTRQYVDAIRDTKARILDTRKTLPILRAAQKHAVRCGGGVNHRMGLYDAVLIKENHILAAGSVSKAVASIRRLLGMNFKVEIEVETLQQLKDAIFAGVDQVLLDNMDIATLKEAVAIANGRAVLEASGGITLANLHEHALTGVDFISTGAITKHVRAIDLSLRFLPAPT